MSKSMTWLATTGICLIWAVAPDAVSAQTQPPSGAAVGAGTRAGGPSGQAGPTGPAASPAASQTVLSPVENTDQVSTDQDIVVTARGRQQRLQDVPVAVSVVSGAALERGNLRSIEDVSARLPSVKITSGPLVDQINIRGVGSGQNSGFEQSVATFVDGLYRGRSRSTRAALFDVERVEVLKGPQTTFFGANAIAGALNIVTRKPGQTAESNASALYAFEDGEFNLEAGVTLPVSETLSIRVAGRSSGIDGYVRNTLSGRDGPRDRSVQGRVAIAWQPVSNLRSDLRVDAGRSRTRDAFPFELTGCPAPSPIVTPPGTACARYLAANGGQVDDDVDFHSASPASFARYHFVEAGWTNVLDVDGGAVTSITGYFDQRYRSRLQTIPFPLPGTVRGYDGLPVELGESYHQFSQELRYQSTAGGTFEYMAGGYFAQDTLDTYNTVGFFFLPFGAFNPTGTTNANTPVTGRPVLHQESRTLSAFGSLTIRPIQPLRVNLGLRYSNIRKEADRDTSFGTSANAVSGTYQRFPTPLTQTIFASILGADLGPFADPRRTDDKFMPSVSVQYDLTGTVMAYASYSRGFKAGGYSAASLANSFEPETVNAYEAGLKTQLLDRRLTLNTAVFRSDYDDLQEATVIVAASGTIVSLVQNAAGSRSQGVELGASYRFSPRLSIGTDLAYVDSKYTDYPAGPCTILGNSTSPTCVQDLSGKRRPYAPRWSGNVTASANLPIASGYVLKVDPTMYFSSRFFEAATADPFLAQRGFVKFDLRVGVGPEDGRWDLAVVGKNLTDRTTAGFRQAVTFAPGSVFALPDRPRAIALQFSIRG